MGWSLGFDDRWNRDIGYGVPAYCDYPGCKAEIDRGLGYVCCASEPYGGENGCGRFYCSDHENWKWDGDEQRVCGHADDENVAAEHPRWIAHKLTHESWQRWRDANPDDVARLNTLSSREDSST